MWRQVGELLKIVVCCFRTFYLGKLEHHLDSKSKFTLSLAASKDGKYLATGAIDGIINVFDLLTKKLVHTLEGHAMPIRCMSVLMR